MCDCFDCQLNDQNAIHSNREREGEGEERESGARECRDDCMGNGPAENAIDLAPISSLLLKVYAEERRAR